MAARITAERVAELGRAFVAGLRELLGEDLHAALLFGAAAMPDPAPTGDVDFHVILEREPTASQVAALEALHERLAREYPPLGGEMDGHYLVLEEARRAAKPRSRLWRGAIDESWALHREHVRGGRCIVLHGPDPKSIYPPAAWPELEEALRGELRYVEAHLEEYPHYAVLNLCRLMYSFETRDVAISKAEAADWAARALPDWRPCIERARRVYAGKATPEDRDALLARIGERFRFARDRIEAAVERGGRP